MDVTQLPVVDMVAAFREGRLSPIDVTQASLDRVRDLDGGLNAFCLVDEEQAKAAARESAARWKAGTPKGLLDGVPTAIKDAFLTKGWPTLRGSRTVDANQSWHEDAPMVARLREHGAVLLGKTTLPEHSWKIIDDSPLTGFTRNPWNRDRTPGGSSGGSAVAVAAGMCAFAIATDTAGSTRAPASFTGLFGFKPSHGLAATYPTGNFGSLHHIGPLTRTVADAVLALRAITGPDPRDADCLPQDTVDWTGALDADLRGMRFAFSPDFGHHGIVDPEVAAAVSSSIALFRSLGAEVDEADLNLTDVVPVMRTIACCGMARMVNATDERMRDQMDPGLVAIARVGAGVTVTDYIGAMIHARGAISARMNIFHQRYDILIAPTMPMVALATGAQHPGSDGPTDFLEWSPFCHPFNLTRQPAASIPCGFSSDGLPIGLQIVGPRFGDMTVLRASSAFETLRPIQLPNVR